MTGKRPSLVEEYGLKLINIENMVATQAISSKSTPVAW
jgi:hypothetical protein